MRRAVVAVLSVLLTAVGLGAVAAPAHAGGPPEPGATLTETVTLQFWSAARPDTAYCATGVFAPFADKVGWQPSTVQYVYTINGASSTLTKSLTAPYDDAFTINGLSNPPAAGTHHAMLEAPSYRAGSANCSDLTATQHQRYPATAIVTYVRPAACESAIATYATAADKVAAAQKALKKARTDQAKAAAQAKLKAAKAKQAKAKKKYKKAC